MPRVSASRGSPRAPKNHARFWLQCGTNSLIRQDRPQSYDAAVKQARKFFPKPLEGKRIAFRTTYANVSADGQAVDLQTINLTQESWGSYIDTIEGLQIIAYGPGDRVGSTQTDERTIMLDVRHLDSDTARLQVTCTSVALWRDVVETFFKHMSSSTGDSSPADICLLWWAQPEGMSIYQTVGESLGDSEDAETVYIAPKQKLGQTLDKPMIYIWTAKSQRVTVNLTLPPEWEFASLFPIAPVTTSDSRQTTAWRMFTRGGGKLLDEETGLELMSLSCEMRSKVSTSACGFRLGDEDSVLLRVTESVGYLNSSLKALGLHVEARASFLRYFLPSFIGNEYIAIRFLSETLYSQVMNLDITPVPDVLVRIFMIFKGISSDEIGAWPRAQARVRDPAIRWRRVVGLPELDQLQDRNSFRILEWGAARRFQWLRAALPPSLLDLFGPGSTDGGDLHGGPISSADSSQTDVPLNAQQLPPVDRGRQAWTFCFCSFILETLVWGFGFSYGIFQAYYTTHTPFQEMSHLAVAAVGPTSVAIEYGEGIILAFFLNRYPDLYKQTMWAGLALSTISLFLSSFVSRIELLILLQGIGVGIGGGLLYWPGLFMTNEWFVRRRGLASGIIFAGSGLGGKSHALSIGFVFPLMVKALLDEVGFRWTLRIWAAFMAVVGIISVWLIRHRTPVPKFSSGRARPRLVPARLPFFKRSIFWVFSTATLLQAMSYFPVSLYIAIFAETVSSPLSATIVLSLFNSAGVVGQIVIGYLCDHLPYPRVMLVTTLASSLAAFLLWGFADTLPRVFAFAIVFGALSGGFSSAAFTASSESVGPNQEQASIAITAITFLKGVAAIVGPIISGLLLEAGQSTSLGKYGKFGFGPVEIFVGSCAAASSLSSIAVAVSRPKT
ncbi:hypothetical protein EIP91_000739 [Steccherinum ochraceum]|uniref:Major facilitator superfamily (MFS) profile domain-containing protein n=1 Tax=Steccherinum ochraceum TaxID=92696 RepID=A0A4R0RF50_9APHY|nr:hypothetical protein EIP91_000739 [Steccherinum ochraceum]